MYCVRNVTDDLYWVGANDHRLALFENIHPIPRGVSYNAYLLLDEQTVLFDTVDWSACRQLLENVEHLLGERPLDYLVINHMEPDHCATLGDLLRRWPNVQVVANAKTVPMIGQFFDCDISDRTVVVKEGDTLTLRMAGGGPAGTLLAVADSNGNVKACPENPVVELPLNDRGKLDVAGAVGRDGYLAVIRDLGLLDSRVAVLLPGLVSVFNFINMRTHFESLPAELEESAKLDGANHWTIFTRVILPISGATMAVMVLFYGVAHWNSWFREMLYLPNSRDLWPLALITREIILSSSNAAMSDGAVMTQEMADAIKYATIIVTTLPILCLYPFLQKYFAKGVTVGAVKG